MSEEKIIQHSVNALHVLQNKEKGWGKKLREFFVEILIIVFAVSITLLLHNWNDERHERRLEREFLAGIKSDLDSGAVDIKEGITYFQPTLDYMMNVRQQITTHQINAAYLDSNSWAIGNTLYFEFDRGRFEAFKSSGYLRLIENQTLLKHLMTLYTITIPFQVEADQGAFGNHQRYYEQYIGPRATFIMTTPQDNRILASKLIDDPFFRYYIFDYSSLLQERKMQKESLAKEMKQTAAEITAELNK